MFNTFSMSFSIAMVQTNKFFLFKKCSNSYASFKFPILITKTALAQIMKRRVHPSVCVQTRNLCYSKYNSSFAEIFVLILEKYDVQKNFYSLFRSIRKPLRFLIYLVASYLILKLPFKIEESNLYQSFALFKSVKYFSVALALCTRACP